MEERANGLGGGIEMIYSTLFDIEREIIRRRSDNKLMKKVTNFFGDLMPNFFNTSTMAVISRSIATPNAELAYFLELAEAMRLEPLILEYPDKFVAKNMDKYHLCKLYFSRSFTNKNPIISDTKNIINFNKNEGRMFGEILTHWGEEIIPFHHRLLLSRYPQLSGKFIDFSDWFNKARIASEYYYLYFLSLFICHGVLFENFIFTDFEENQFITKKLLPSFYQVEKIFGVKPLIFPLLPSRYVQKEQWYAYPESQKIGLEDGHSQCANCSMASPHFPKIYLHCNSRQRMGVFSAEKIKKGSVIRILSGEIISFEECIRRINVGHENQLDSLQVELEVDMDLDEISRTFNHSCDPNAGIRKISELIAIKDIEYGEEITFDYSATVGPNIPASIWSLKCDCGTKNCRKILKNVLSIPETQLKVYQLNNALQDYILNELSIIRQSGGKLPDYPKITITIAKD